MIVMLRKREIESLPGIQTLVWIPGIYPRIQFWHC